MSLMSDGPLNAMLKSNGVVGIHPFSDLNNSSLPGVAAPSSMPSAAKTNGAVVDQHPPFEHDREDEEDSTSIDIVPRNVVCSFSVGCHLDLKKIAWHGCNVQYKNNSVVLMKLRHPLCTAHIYNTGKVTCTGSNTEVDAKRACRKIARFLQKLSFPVKFRSFKIVNVLATCVFPFGVKLNNFAMLDRSNASYEPELHPGVTYKCADLKATLKIFSTGSVTITAGSLRNVQIAVERVYPLCSSCQKPKDGGARSNGVMQEDEIYIEEELNYVDQEAL